ncbi:guanitoxin biosynthesis PLP-dependent (S)-gamma-hydroxy-L-arginine cyclodehydratase GntC [Nostoc sp. 'Peltigera membranacea cyanobiont' 232]|uniref:guanitoxin biosynthesis PLP-dependent (S)-gamma-hydroxy-L-arginine cyclodehydratase GntC n=1 Tax=Nostoc sp. 'Peltigera membranacea cyanobiont' 232 TaxID=2014531 RepID=UPI000B9538DF|nr:guanitoxin biosynthesis PLP-dependent (S)-gamma-hydroxy-L-arginine cyclodehydratase GntC [Nostoc sp. 'Peltigera membranacea cyanobiont' 232]OYE04340.1 hypothetical protein CDG79_13755 [Nostoc sp. 'Peltigera membranacea cyanobiont' 232]
MIKNIPSFLEIWLSKYEQASYNLGESGVANQSVGDLIQLLDDPEELYRVSLANNDTYGSLELRKAISTLYDGVDPESILVTAGTTEAILIYFHVRYTAGANVVVFVPAFHILPEVPEFLGYEVRKIPLRPENNFRPDLEELTKTVDERTKVIVLNTPHNPTGIVFSNEEVQAILVLAQKHGADVLADEHYRFIPHTDTPSILPSLYGKSPQVIALGSPGKCFGCIGLRIGWLIGSKEIVCACHDFKDYTTHTVCSLNDLLARTVLLNWQKILPKYQTWVTSNVAQFRQFVERQSDHVGWIEPEAGTVILPFLKDSTLGSEAFFRELVEDTGVLVLAGEAFDMPGYFRVGLGVEPKFFKTALERFSQFLAKKNRVII